MAFLLEHYDVMSVEVEHKRFLCVFVFLFLMNIILLHWLFQGTFVFSCTLRLPSIPHA